MAIPGNPWARVSRQAESLRLVWAGYDLVARRQQPVALCAVRSARRREVKWFRFSVSKEV